MSPYALQLPGAHVGVDAGTLEVCRGRRDLAPPPSHLSPTAPPLPRARFLLLLFTPTRTPSRRHDGNARTSRHPVGRPRTRRLLHRADLDQLPAWHLHRPAVHDA